MQVSKPLQGRKQSSKVAQLEVKLRCTCRSPVLCEPRMCLKVLTFLLSPVVSKLLGSTVYETKSQPWKLRHVKFRSYIPCPSQHPSLSLLAAERAYIEIKFPCHTALFNMCCLMALSIFTELSDKHYYQILEYFHHPNRNGFPLMLHFIPSPASP